MDRGAPAGESVVLEVAQLEALLAKTFGLGLDVGRGKEKVALVRLRLACEGAGRGGRGERAGDRVDRHTRP